MKIHFFLSLEDLVSHTNSRILEGSECYKAFENVPLGQSVTIEAEYKVGWHSATGQSVYKQNFDAKENKEKFVAESVLTTCLVPRRFCFNGVTIWENVPMSVTPSKALYPNLD